MFRLTASISLSVPHSRSLPLPHSPPPLRIDLVKAEISDARQTKATTNSLENGNLKLLPAVAYFAAHDVLSEAFLSFCLVPSLFQLLKCLKKLGVKTKFVHKAIHFKKGCHKKNYQAKVEKELFDNMAATHTDTAANARTQLHLSEAQS